MIPRATGAGAVALASLAVLFVGMRWWLAVTPPLSETNYDEALTGLMALAILRGEPQVFYWGQPYLGAVDAYVAAAGFRLAGPSALALRLAIVGAALGWLLSVWAMGRRVAGPAWGMFAALAVAVPPIFLSFVQLSAHGQTMAVTLGAVTLAAGAALVDSAATGWRRAALWLTLGLSGGLGWWASQTTAMFLVAVALAVPAARPGVLREPGPYVALAAFAVASLPFWLWNARHEFATFWHLATWGDPLPVRFVDRLATVTRTVAQTLHGYYWDGRLVRLPPVVAGMGWVPVGVYAGGVLVAAACAATWLRRLARRETPWRRPLDVVALAFWLTCLAHLFTWFGTSGVLRYALTFYVTLPVLAACGLARVARWRPARWAAVAAAMLVVVHGFATHRWFVVHARELPSRPVDALLARLDALGIRGCYADSRIAQVITFESAERIACADHYGLRNFALLQAVDAMTDPATVGIVTHHRLQGPAPPEMETVLGTLGARFERETIGDYVVFHGFSAPGPPVRPLAPTGWHLAGPAGSGDPSLAFDRQVWTAWAPTGPGPVTATLDLGRVHEVAQVILEGSGGEARLLSTLRLDTSPDGEVWAPALHVRRLLSGGHWWRGHPRLDRSGRLILRFTPRNARFLRLAAGPEDRLAIAELFVYETATDEWAPPGTARAAYDAAEALLARWMDDPTGPHPRRAPVTTGHRRRQVAWSRVFAEIDHALTQAPDWDEAHHLYNHALALWGWHGSPDVQVAQARADGAWTEVLRWAAAAERDPTLWRSGRAAARAEALERLGRPVEAAAVRQAATRDSVAAPPSAVFGNAIELIRVDLPAEVRPGQRVPVRYTWRLARRVAHDYTAFVHIRGPERLLQHDHRVGAGFGTSHWEVGETVEETLELDVPSDAPPGRYEVAVGLWSVATRRRLDVGRSTLPERGRAVLVGAVTVVPAKDDGSGGQLPRPGRSPAASRWPGGSASPPRAPVRADGTPLGPALAAARTLAPAR